MVEPEHRSRGDPLAEEPNLTKLELEVHLQNKYHGRIFRTLGFVIRSNFKKSPSHHSPAFASCIVTQSPPYKKQKRLLNNSKTNPSHIDPINK